MQELHVGVAMHCVWDSSDASVLEFGQRCREWVVKRWRIDADFGVWRVKMVNSGVSGGLGLWTLPTEGE